MVLRIVKPTQEQMSIQIEKNPRKEEDQKNGT